MQSNELPREWKTAGPDVDQTPVRLRTTTQSHDTRRFRIQYCDLGSGEQPLLLIHGIGGSLNTWSAVLPQLARHNRVIAVDLPGFGASSMPKDSRLDMALTVEAVSTLVDALGIERFTLAGHSMGALVSLAIAAKRADSIDGLLIISGALHSIIDLHRPCDLIQRGELLTAIGRARVYVTQLLGAGLPMPTLVSRAISRSAILREVALRPFVRDPHALPDDLLLSVLDSTGRLGVFYAALAAFSFRYEPLLHSVTDNDITATLINGEHDDVSSTSDLKRLWQELGRTDDVIIVREAGHWLPVEQPQTLAHLVIESWLRL